MKHPHYDILTIEAVLYAFSCIKKDASAYLSSPLNDKHKEKFFTKDEDLILKYKSTKKLSYEDLMEYKPKDSVMRRLVYLGLEQES
jgi:hypothetical protein